MLSPVGDLLFFICTYWDGCLIDTLPTAKTWADVYKGTTACVTAKEKALIEKNTAKNDEGMKLIEQAKKLYEEDKGKLDEAKGIFEKGKKLVIDNPVPKPSYPQAFAGKLVKDLEVPN